MRLRITILLSALLCGATAVSAAGAAGPADASFAVKPVLYDPALTATKSYFILAAKPGAVIHDRMRIVNTGGKTGTAFLYPVDATTGQTSGAVYLDRTKPRRDVGRWITLSRSKVQLAPGADAVVPFTIHVPRTVRPGDHLGGIVAENAQVQTSSGHGALQIRIRHLTIAAVQLQLPGPAAGIVLPTAVRAGGEHGFQYVYVHLKSTGTVMMKPVAVLTVRNAAGHVVARRKIQLDTFLPRTAIDYPALLPKKALVPGKYTADVRIHSTGLSVPGYREAQPPAFDLSRTFPFTVTNGEQTKVFSGAAPVTPPTQAKKPSSSSSKTQRAILVAILGLLVLILVLLLLLLRRSRKRKQGTPVSPSPVAGPPSKTSDRAPEPAAAGEELGWAGLLAAYESQPRHQVENGWAEPAEPEPAEPEPAEPEHAEPVRAEPVQAEPVQAEAEAPHAVPDMPTLVPSATARESFEPPAFATPVVAAVAGAAAAAALAPDPVFDPEPVPAPAPVLVPAPEPEPVQEPGFELQPEPWFEPEPEVEELPEPEPVQEPGFELQPEPWFEPEPEVELDEEVPAVRPAAEPTTVIDAEALRTMIVQHDLSVAQGSIQRESQHIAAPVASEPEPLTVRLPVAVPADVRAYAEENNLSSALVEASLIALAAVIAARLLRNDD